MLCEKIFGNAGFISACDYRSVKEKMMILRIDEKETDKYKACLTPEVMKRLRDKTETGIAFVDDEGQPKGALTISSVEGMEGQYGKNAVIEYFFVLPKFRRQGVFREMLSFVKDRWTNINGAAVQVILPGMEQEEEVLNALHFERLDDGNEIVSLPVDTVEYTVITDPNTQKMMDELIPLEELMEGQRKMFLKAFEKDLPAGLRPQELPGRILLGHSFVYLTPTGDYGGFLLSSELPDGTLYLGAMFVKPVYKHMAIPLLGALFSAATDPKKKRRYREIMYATATPEARRLSKHILEGYEEDIKVRQTHNYYLEFE